MEIKERTYWKREDQILTASIPYGVKANQSSRILINLWFHCLRDNTIIFTNPREIMEGNRRKIYYDIDKIGRNIGHHDVDRFMNLVLETTTLQWILILIRFKEVMNNPNLSFFYRE